MAENREHLVNLRNHQREDVPLSDHASAVREATLAENGSDRQVYLQALSRLKLRAVAGDEVVADLLILLGLADG